ncbi:helix-hairpin-helix domain-containing protein [Crocinitomicaceae bacterium]|nr:helix-hairpin-helix domain-containing protein [Crocinitomicaceae bacterium]
MDLSKRNRRALFGLVFILLFIAVLPRVVNALYTSEVPRVSFTKLKEAHKELVAIKKEKKKSKKRNSTSKFKKLTQKLDPNEFLLDDWMRMGLSKKQADIVLNFSVRGLKSNDDLKKIFVFPEKLFDLIKDSLVYPVEKDYQLSKDRSEEKPILKLVVEINSATQVDLEKIPGIGPYFANKIIEYRIKLGGFVSKNQLLEIWKFDAEKLSSIDKYIILDDSFISKINVNSISFDDLKDHPYFSYKVANSIVKMREVSGSYENVNEIGKSMLINDELLDKLTPYISIK